MELEFWATNVENGTLNTILLFLYKLLNGEMEHAEWNMGQFMALRIQIAKMLFWAI